MKKFKINIEVKQHQGYTEWADSPTVYNQMFGRHQFIYKHGKYKISLVELKDTFENKWFWEIYCLRGNLFEDCERFNAKQLAENRILILLNDALHENDAVEKEGER